MPIKLGLLPKQIYQRPAIEIDPYIHKKDDTFGEISKRFKKPQISRFSSTKSLSLMTPFNKLRKSLSYFDLNSSFLFVSNYKSNNLLDKYLAGSSLNLHRVAWLCLIFYCIRINN